MNSNPSDKPPELADYPVVIQLPVQWGDQDAFGHVNNTVPIRWYESCRINYLEQSGLGRYMSKQGLGPILARISCDYRRQLHYPDAVLIGGRITEIGRTSMTMKHAVFSVSQQAIAAEGDSIIVVFDYETNRPVRVPDDVRAAVESHERPRSE